MPKKDEPKPKKHRHDKAAAGHTYDVQQGVYIVTWQEQKCSQCGKPMGRRKISKVQSPLRARLGRKAGKMVWPDYKDKKDK